MDKSFLEKRIEEKAVELFEKDYREFLELVRRNSVGELLKIKIGEKDIPLTTFGRNYAIFNTEQENNSRKVFTNYDEVKAKLIDEYIAKETNKVIEQIQSIGYLFNN